MLILLTFFHMFSLFNKYLSAGDYAVYIWTKKTN